jgi:hypothetical protein
MQRLFRVFGLVAFACGLPAAVSAQQPRASSFETGVYIDFGPSFLDYQNIGNAERCRDLCLQDRRCRVWRYVAATAPAEYGRARRLCVLGEGAPQTRTRPGSWAISGQVR